MESGATQSLKVFESFEEAYKDANSTFSHLTGKELTKNFVSVAEISRENLEDPDDWETAVERNPITMVVEYDNSFVLAVIKGNAVFVEDKAINEFVRLGSIDQCEREFAEYNE